LALLGIALGLTRRRDRLLAVLAGVVVAGTLVNAFFVSAARHSARLLPVLVAAGAAGLAETLTRRRHGAAAPDLTPQRRGTVPDADWASAH